MEDNGKIKLKLNVKKTITVGLAFMAICMFWQVYDNLMPLMLRELGFKETLRGVVMCLDNVLALVLLPFMGQWSDNLTGKIRNKYGRRMPFIVVGSILAAFFFILVNFSFNMAKGETVNSVWLAIMMVTTAFLLISMSLYRTPAVALMPDVTPKEIRSQGNTIINIMGTIGGVIPTALMSFNVFLKTYETVEDGVTVKHMEGNNWLLVGVISALMILATIVLMVKVNENKMVEEKRKLLESIGISEDSDVEVKKDKISIKEGLTLLDKGQRKSLLFILISVSMWYFAYNGVTSHFSAFALDVLGLDKFSTALLVGQASAFVFYIPASKLGEKIGRKKTIMLGVILMILGFGFGQCAYLYGKRPRLPKICYVPRIRLGRCRLGDYKRSFVCHERRNGYRKNDRSIYRIVLFVLHGGANSYADTCGFLYGKDRTEMLALIRNAVFRTCSRSDELRKTR